MQLGEFKLNVGKTVLMLLFLAACTEMFWLYEDTYKVSLSITLLFLSCSKTLASPLPETMPLDLLPSAMFSKYDIQVKEVSKLTNFDLNLVMWVSRSSQLTNSLP